MKLDATTLLAGLLLSSAVALADEGMWLMNEPPRRQLKEAYGFEPSAAWLEHLQKSCVRMGASGSFVSADGLVMTNHHVGSDQIEKLSSAERNLMRDGFYAATREQELRCPDMEVEALWSIEDVTKRVEDAAAGKPTAEAEAARRKAMSEIEAESMEQTKLKSEVVTLWRGARYHLYRYKRYTDVRLVWCPEQSVAFFGGDNDNFEYPRFCLDACFFRVYEDGKPLRPEHFLTLNTGGVADGDLVVVAGHPARTQRLFSVNHLNFLRDMEMPHLLNLLWRREVQLQTFMSRSDENFRIGEGDLFGTQNSRKAFWGIYSGLLDPAIMVAKQAEEQQIRAALRSGDRDDPLGQISDSLASYSEIFEQQFLLNGRGMRSDLLSAARTVVRLAEELPKPSAERLREYRDSELESVYLSLYSEAPIHPALEVQRLASSISYAAEQLGAEHAISKALLGGMAPLERAQQLVGETTLRDIAARRSLVEGGQSAVQASKDPLIRLAQAIDATSRAVRKQYEDTVQSVQTEAYARLAATRFTVFGDRSYPDATFTLRLSYGAVRGYEEDGAQIPPFTSIGGIFERSEQRGAKLPFALPQRWLDARGKLSLATPFNFVCTADIIGGNSGSPVVDRDGRVVGLIFDGNIHSLVWDIAYTERRGRAVAVDVRGIVEALRSVYAADALVAELTGR